jgi:hypothetical protein
MPTSAEITSQASRIASDGIVLAMAWHVAVIAAFIALGSGWRPTRRTAGILLSSLAASVGVVAWLAGNPFNGSVFCALAVVQLVVALRLTPGRIERGPGWAVIGGTLCLLFGVGYPHFLAGHSLALYVVAAPIGLIPCPTLAVLLGFTLIAGGLGSVAWSSILLVAATFYGLFGILKLGVLLDAGLLAGAAALGVLITSSTASAPITRWRRARAR